jgi:hypothetical protein
MQTTEFQEIERKMDELARRYAATHDPSVKAKLEELAHVSTALDVLIDALGRCRDEDMRTSDVAAALDFLAQHASEQWPFAQLIQKGSEDSNEEGRWQNLNASLNGIKLAVTAWTR